MSAYKVPLKKRVRHWFSKWTIADLLNNSSRTCWSSLVAWVLYEPEGDPEEDANHKLRYHVSGANYCREESKDPRILSCYCGKFTNGCLTRKGQIPGDIS